MSIFTMSQNFQKKQEKIIRLTYAIIFLYPIADKASYSFPLANSETLTFRSVEESNR